MYVVSFLHSSGHKRRSMEQDCAADWDGHKEKTFEMGSTRAGNVVAVAIEMEATHGLFAVHLMADIQK